MNKIQRYRQGFGFFGPLEKCNDGPLMNAEEAINKMEEMADMTNDLLNRCETWTGYANDWRDLYMCAKKQCNFWEKRATIWVVVAVIEFVVMSVLIAQFLGASING